MYNNFLNKLQESEIGRKYVILVKNADKCTTWKKGYERHHILPKSMGGSNEYSNLVRLTPYEHILAHYYLAVSTEDPRMLHAFVLMTGENRFKKLSEIQKISLEELEGWAELRQKALAKPCGQVGCLKISKKAKERWKRFRETGQIDEIRKNISKRTKEGMQKPESLQKLRVNLGSKWYFSSLLDKTMHWYPGDPVPDPNIWKPGRRPMNDVTKQRLSTKQRSLKRVFYHNDTLKINKRFGPGDNIPEGFIRGKAMEYCGNRREYEKLQRKEKYKALGASDESILKPKRHR